MYYMYSLQCCKKSDETTNDFKIVEQLLKSHLGSRNLTNLFYISAQICDADK